MNPNSDSNRDSSHFGLDSDSDLEKVNPTVQFTTLVVPDSNLDSTLLDSDSRKLRWIRIRGARIRTSLLETHAYLITN